MSYFIVKVSPKAEKNSRKENYFVAFLISAVIALNTAKIWRINMKKVLFFLLAFAVLFAVLGCGSGGGGGGTGGNPVKIEDEKEDDVINLDDFYTSPKAPASPRSFNDKTALEFAGGIKIGWNLGNTLDANDLGWLGANPSVASLEKAWCGVVTTQANIDALKDAGFNAIRIPVSWTKCADSKHIIRKDWMDRVTEIVNYAVTNDMYIILNTHHDEDVFKFKNADKAAAIKAFKIIWGQIAVNFRNYSEKLIFEALNEPRTPGSAGEWNGGTAEERNNLNEYYKAFVEIVRAGGGNNDRRFILLNPYAASGGTAAMNALVIPADTAQDKVIVSFHSYSPYNFALNKTGTDVWSESGSDKTDITNSMDAYKTKFIDKGIPVLIGEFGAMHKDNTDVRAAWAKFYVSEAGERGIPCFWWDNHAFEGTGELFGLLNRNDNTFPFPEIISALMEGVTP
jgi:endoglucanase